MTRARHGRAGEAQADFLAIAGLAAGEAAAVAWRRAIRIRCLGAVAKVLADEGIHLESSTALLEPLLARAGVLTQRAPTEQERKNIDVRAGGGAAAGALRHWADGGDRRSGVRGGRGDGRNGRGDRAGGGDYAVVSGRRRCAST